MQPCIKSVTYKRAYTSHILIQTYSTRLDEINEFIQYFSGLKDKLISEDDLIEILVNIATSYYHKVMVTINFEPIQKTLTQVVEYLECLT